MSGSLKVVLIGSAHPLRGGLSAYNERLVREYLSVGANAEIITFTLQYPSVFFPGKTQYTQEPPPAGLRIRILINSVNPFNWIRIGWMLKKQKPDLIIVKFWIPFMAPCFGTICRIARLNRHTRIVSVVDNIIPHEKRPGDRILAKYWIGSVNGFVAMSHSVMKELEEFNRSKPRVFCPHPLYDNFGDPVTREDALHNLNLDPGYRYILFFGFIRDYKGLDILLKAFADECFDTSGIRLLVAGEFYSDPAPFLSILDIGKLRERVIMSNDFIPDSEVRNYFCAADLVVQPYKTATQSGVTQIAYHFNKPMVITDVGGLSEFVPDGKVGYVVKPEPSDIAGAILRFFREGKEEEFSRNAALEKRKYAWGKMVDSIQQAAGLNRIFEV